MNMRGVIEEFKLRLKAPWVALERVAQGRYLPKIFAAAACNELQLLIRASEKNNSMMREFVIIGPMKEVTADIRNKLQRPKTILEKFSKGKAVSKRMAKLALGDLKKLVDILIRLEDKARN